MGARRTVQEVPLAQPPLPTLDARNALTAQHEEVLLCGVGVIQTAWLAGVEHRELDPEVLKALRLDVGSLAQDRHVRLEETPGAERLVRHPGGIFDVHHEPARRHRRQTRTDVFEPRLWYLARHAVGVYSGALAHSA